MWLFNSCHLPVLWFSRVASLLPLIIHGGVRRNRGSTCHLHGCTDPTSNSEAWGKFTWRLCPIIPSEAKWTVWASRSVGSTVSDAALSLCPSSEPLCRPSRRLSSGDARDNVDAVSLCRSAACDTQTPPQSLRQLCWCGNGFEYDSTSRRKMQHKVLSPVTWTKDKLLLIKHVHMYQWDPSPPLLLLFSSWSPPVLLLFSSSSPPLHLLFTSRGSEGTNETLASCVEEKWFGVDWPVMFFSLEVHRVDMWIFSLWPVSSWRRLDSSSECADAVKQHRAVNDSC